VPRCSCRAGARRPRHEARPAGPRRGRGPDRRRRARPDRDRADLTRLRSDEPRRDSALSERGIETNRYPKATFRLVGGFDVKPAGQRVNGSLSLHGRSAPITVTVEGATRRDGVEDEGLLEFRILAVPR
jgi:hypothetical protein